MTRMIVKGPEFCAVTEDGILTEYITYTSDEQCGKILLGKADRLMPGLNCAFIDIGRKKNGFLPLDEESVSFTGQKVRSGDTMIVQVKKEESSSKGAFLTRDISLPGRLVILMPMNRYIGVSRRISDDRIRDMLKKTGASVSGGRFGLVLRFAAAEAEEPEIRRETDALYAAWQQIQRSAATGGRPGSLLLDTDPAERLKEDYAATGIDQIAETDSCDPAIKRQLMLATERKLCLPGGGNIIIDRCEAMTVIDVNTASSTGSGNKEQTVLETNLEACGLIAQQVRLRNLSGIILIDFIDMNSETDRSLVYSRLTEKFSADRTKTVIHGWTHLGLIEMTRKRSRPSLYDELFTTCKACGGKGYMLREQET